MKDRVCVRDHKAENSRQRTVCGWVCDMMQVLIVTTGSQGEPRAQLSMAARDQSRVLKMLPGVSVGLLLLLQTTMLHSAHLAASLYPRAFPPEPPLRLPFLLPPVHNIYHHNTHTHPRTCCCTAPRSSPAMRAR